jgi:hypothetical protein
MEAVNYLSDLAPGEELAAGILLACDSALLNGGSN